jgi:hypothetical protein
VQVRERGERGQWAVLWYPNQPNEMGTYSGEYITRRWLFNGPKDPSGMAPEVVAALILRKWADDVLWDWEGQSDA